MANRRETTSGGLQRRSPEESFPPDFAHEVQRPELVAEHVGQTGPKTQAVLNAAKAGVLFIDEARLELFLPVGLIGGCWEAGECWGRGEGFTELGIA